MAEQDLAQSFTSPKDLHVHRGEDDFLGKGEFGYVYKCYDADGNPKAVKLFSLHGSIARIKKGTALIAREAQIMKVMERSQYVIDLHALTNMQHSIGLVMEYVPRGTLYDLISERKVPWPLRLRILYETASGLAHLHSARFDKRVTHNDLKPDNILITEDFHAKICDFGGSNLAAHTSQLRLGSPRDPSSNVHTANYAAPEFLSEETDFRTRAMDVYSYGMITYFVLTRRHPFENRESRVVIFNIANGVLPSFEKNEILNADSEEEAIVRLLESKMRDCWQQNPQSRPTIAAVKDGLETKLVDVKENVVEKIVAKLKVEMPLTAKSNASEWIDLEAKCRTLFVPKLKIPFDRDDIIFPATQLRPPPPTNIKATCSTEVRPSGKSGVVKPTTEIDISHTSASFQVGDKVYIKTARGLFATSIESVWYSNNG